MATKAKRKVGSPAQNQTTRTEEVARPKQRVPLHGMHRDVLTVQGKDKAFVYRWVKDVDETGQRIFRFKEAGYEFAPSNGLTIGEHSVYKSDKVSSAIVRRSSGTDGQWLYLMRIKREWYDEDQAAKLDYIKERKGELIAQKDAPGFYGDLRIGDPEDL